MRASRIARWIIGGVTCVVAAGLGFVYWYDAVGQRSDPNFDLSVAHPDFVAGDGPRVTFDVGHRNFHTPSGRYQPLAELLRNDGYKIDQRSSAFTEGSLAGLRILVIANALGPEGHEARAAFTQDEDSALAAWVQHGGSLLLIADHVPFASAARQLAQSFGVTMYLAFARD